MFYENSQNHERDNFIVLQVPTRSLSSSASWWGIPIGPCRTRRSFLWFGEKGRRPVEKLLRSMFIPFERNLAKVPSSSRSGDTGTGSAPNIPESIPFLIFLFDNPKVSSSSFAFYHSLTVPTFFAGKLFCSGTSRNPISFSY